MREALLQDLRYAWRGLRNHPWFSVGAILTLTISIAANTAVFSVLDAILLHPLSLRHVPKPDRVVVLYESNPSLAAFVAERLSPRHKTLDVWQQSARSLEQFAPMRQSTVTIQNESRSKSEDRPGALISPTSLSLLGIQPRLGRRFRSDETRPGRGQIAIISDALYRGMFQSDPRILDRSVLVNGHLLRIVGVLAPDFRMPATWGGLNHDQLQILAPLDQQPTTDKDQQFDLTVFARLRNGYSLEQARTELRAIAARLAKANPADYAGFSVNVNRVQDEDVEPDLQRALLVLQIAVSFVLLIACANVGNLLLTRAVARDKEIAVRMALGAGTVRVLRQILAESLLVSMLAGMIGSGLSFTLVRWISTIAPDVHGFHELRVDTPVLIFTLLASLLSGVLFALPAMWRTLGVQVNETLNRSSRGVSGSSNRLRTALAVGQIALSLVLLVGAGLLLRSLQTLLDVNLGFRRDHLVSARVVLPALRYDEEKSLSFNRQLMAGLSNMPGVKSAAFSTAVPMRGISVKSFEIQGRPTRSGASPSSDWAMTSAKYFQTMGLRLLRGRTYTEGEVETAAPVIVINEQLATTYWPEGNAIGQIIRWGEPAQDSRIIGIVANEHQAGPDTAGHPELYLPGMFGRDSYALARTVGDAQSYAKAMAALVKHLDAGLEADVQTEDAALNDWLAPRRFNMTVISCFAGVAVVLAAVGLYSLLAYSITLRHREIGIRLAIGADPQDVTWMIVRNSLLIAGAGVCIGLACALALTHFIEGLLFGISTHDPITFVVVSGVLCVIAVLAAYVPARQASRIDPVEALRQE